MKESSIKALTIRQPWAELILRGRKPYELRSWRTKYRGPLVIHAAMRVNSDAARRLGLNPEKLVTSAFIGVVVLRDVRPYTREDERGRETPQEKTSGLWMVSAQLLLDFEETAPNLASQRQRSTKLVQGSKVGKTKNR